MSPNLLRFARTLAGASIILLLLFTARADGTQSLVTVSDDLPSSTLIYVSDYFSFVGQDDQGHVAFALDTNRGRDGDAYQAEHFLVFHDEHKGWIELAGNGRFENTNKMLKRIPDSPSFQFKGSPPTGLTVTSEKNHLILRIEPLMPRRRNSHAGAIVWMSSASATLTWQGRAIHGRVIYEYLAMPDFNRLTRTYWGMWKEFQGLYLTAGDHADVYAHSQLSEHIAPLIGAVSGFASFDEGTESMKDLNVTTLHREWTLGFYRWPTAWRITWTGPNGPAVLSLMQSDRKKIGNWAIGGFAMSIVRGELDYAGKQLPIYGLAELIM